MPFVWFEPEAIVAGLGSGMPRYETAETRARRAQQSGQIAAENAARAACEECNHSGFRVIEGRIRDCECVAAVRQLPTS